MEAPIGVSTLTTDAGGNCWTYLGSGSDTLGSEDTTIPARDTSKFQKSGFICIWGHQCGTTGRSHYEYVYYKSKTRTSFNGCERHEFRHDKFDAQEMDEFPRSGRSLPRIHQISIATTSLHEYRLPIRGRALTDEESQDDRTNKYVCLRLNDYQTTDRVEWVEVRFAETRNGISYILSWRYHGLYNQKAVHAPHMTLDPIRHKLGTARFPEIPDGTKVLPVVRVAGPQCGDHESGHSVRGHEYVTPAEGDRSAAKPRYITHAHAHEGWSITHKPHPTSPWPYSHHFTFRISLDDYVDNTYEGGRGRILKFPSGE